MMSECVYVHVLVLSDARMARAFMGMEDAAGRLILCTMKVVYNKRNLVRTLNAISNPVVATVA